MSRLSRVDVGILRVLRRADGIAMPPKAIAYEVDATYRAVKMRLPTLDERGYTERLDVPRGYRRITEDGREAIKERERSERGLRV